MVRNDLCAGSRKTATPHLSPSKILGILRYGASVFLVRIAFFYWKNCFWHTTLWLSFFPTWEPFFQESKNLRWVLLFYLKSPLTLFIFTNCSRHATYSIWESLFQTSTNCFTAPRKIFHFRIVFLRDGLFQAHHVFRVEDRFSYKNCFRRTTLHNLRIVLLHDELLQPHSVFSLESRLFALWIVPGKHKNIST